MPDIPPARSLTTPEFLDDVAAAFHKGHAATCSTSETKANRNGARWVIQEVLDAIAEPSEAMHHGARDWSYKKYGKPIGSDASDGCWRAMFSVLRKEVENG